jgi:hypothetical protein
MAWGYTPSFSQRLPPPRRLTIEELLAQYQQPEPEPAPEPIRSIRDLPDEERKRARLNSLFAGMAAIGGGLQTGQWGRAAEGGLQNITAIEDQALGSVNARQRADYERRVAQQGQEAQAAKRRQETEAVYGMYQKVVDGENPDSPFAKRAELAAREGSMSKLVEQLDQKPQRGDARARGLDPDRWDTLQQMNEELKAEVERRKAAADWVAEQKRLAEKAKLENDAKLELERQQKAESLDNYYQAPPQYEPLSRVAAREELVQGIRDRHEAIRSAGTAGALPGQLHQMRDGSWALIRPADAEHPKPWADPIDGQPQIDGKLGYFMKDGVRYVQNVDHPEVGAVEVETFEKGTDQAPTLDRLRHPDRFAPTEDRKIKVTIPGDPHPERTLEQRVVDVQGAIGALSPAELAAVAESLKTMLPRDVVAEIKRRRGR